MSSLSSASTDTQVYAAYDDNASYAEDNDVSKCRAFITACRILLRRRPASMGAEGRSVAFDAAGVSSMLKAAEEWLSIHSTNAQDAGPRVTRVDFRNFR